MCPPLKRKDPHDAALARVPREVARKVGWVAHVRRVGGVDIAGEQEPVAADAGEDSDVLFAVSARKCDRITDDT